MGITFVKCTQNIKNASIFASDFKKMESNDKYKDIDSLLGGLFKSPTLKELFENKLAELNMTPTTAQMVLGIGYKPLKRLLSATETTIDLTNLFKLADFLQLPKQQVVKMYSESLERNIYQVSEATSPDKVKFIKENFDLAVLRKAGVIDSIGDFGQIEKRIVTRLGLRSIFEYKNNSIHTAFSSGNFNSEHHRTRSFWIHAAKLCFNEINNPYEYDRDQLIKLFPEIRWYSTEKENGLSQVVKRLFKIGITVIFQPSLENLKLRGATFVVNDKPCIVLTDYVGFYPTLWFALIHELYHVLFDLEEIKEYTYHLSDDSNEEGSVKERESLANNFAREYLFSQEKLKMIQENLREHHLVREFALNNHVEPSIIYAFHAFEKGKTDRMAWARLRRYSPPVEPTIAPISFPLKLSNEFNEIFRTRKMNIYN